MTMAAGPAIALAEPGHISRKRNYLMGQFRCYDEIVTQHQAWQQAVDEVSTKASAIRKFFSDLQPTDILITGCGSPFYMAQSVATYWQTALRVRTRAIPASEIVQYSQAYLPPADASPVLVAISRSGATTEVIWALEAFERRYPGRVMAVSCAPGSPLDERSTLSVLIDSGHEQTVPQTRSFAAMYLAAQFIGALVGGQDEVVALLRHAPAHAERLIGQWEGTAQEIGGQSEINHAFYLGSGPLYGIAREGALKMTEMSITPCSAYQFMEARHGPRSIIDSHTLLTGLYGRTAPGHESKVMAEFVDTSGPLSVALTPSQDWKTGDVHYHIPVEVEWPDDILGLAYLPIMHLMAYYRAVACGANPDTSRHLSIYVDLAEG